MHSVPGAYKLRKGPRRGPDRGQTNIRYVVYHELLASVDEPSVSLAALCYLRPVDYCRGHPAALLAERRRKLVTARELRKQENLRLR